MGPQRRHVRLPPGDRAGPEFVRGPLADQRPAAGAVLGGQEIVQRHIRVAVVRFPVRERQLLGFQDGVRPELGGRIEVLVVEPLENGERLKQRRALPPRPRLGDGVSAELHGGGRPRSLPRTRRDPPVRGHPGGPCRRNAGAESGPTPPWPWPRSPRAIRGGRRRSGPRGNAQPVRPSRRRPAAAASGRRPDSGPAPLRPGSCRRASRARPTWASASGTAPPRRRWWSPPCPASGARRGRSRSRSPARRPVPRSRGHAAAGARRRRRREPRRPARPSRAPVPGPRRGSAPRWLRPGPGPAP